MSKGVIYFLIGLAVFQLITVLDEGSKVSPHDKYHGTYQVSSYKSSSNNSTSNSKPSTQKSSAKKSGSSKKSYYDTYDSGYNDVYDNGDYDVDKYNSDENYRSGVDDALDEWEDDFGWSEEW